MPKKQTTAAKKARAAARAGAKYTAALRDTRDSGPHVLPGLGVVDADVLSDGELLVVDCLRALARDGGPLPVVMAEPDPDVAEAWARAEADGVTPRWQRWASVEAAVDGYVLRETRYGPNRSGYNRAARGPRVPVPVRAGDGSVAVYAMPEWARRHEGEWIWVHTGWPVEAPGQIVDPPQSLSPSADLLWEVTAWHDLSEGGVRVAGEDYVGSVAGWNTVGWCATREDARLIARAYTAHRGDYTRADVIEHGPYLNTMSTIRDTFLQAPDAPVRVRAAAAAGPRPASPDRSEVPEPVWRGGGPGDRPPTSSLVVWTGTGWRTLVWTDWQTSVIAAHLGIGAGGPYEWAESWGPRHPDRDMHDWTQEGREIHGYVPEMPYQERSRLIAAERAAHEDALIAALADRGGLTRDQAAARLREGGEAYRDVLDVGRAVISRALHTARRALPEGPERTAVRHAIDDLMNSHLLPADAERIANAQLDTEIEAQRVPASTAWCRRAVAEYITPAPDPASVGIDGFSTPRP